MNNDYALWGIAVTLGLACLAIFFRGPKEAHTELESRVKALEISLAGLSVTMAGSHAKHDQALNSLTAAVNRLTERFDEVMARANGRTR